VSALAPAAATYSTGRVQTEKGKGIEKAITAAAALQGRARQYQPMPPAQGGVHKASKEKGPQSLTRPQLLLKGRSHQHQPRLSDAFLEYLGGKGCPAPGMGTTCQIAQVRRGDLATTTTSGPQ